MLRILDSNATLSFATIRQEWVVKVRILVTLCELENVTFETRHADYDIQALPGGSRVGVDARLITAGKMYHIFD